MKNFGVQRETVEIDIAPALLGGWPTIGEARCGRAEDQRLQDVISLADILLNRYGRDLKALRLIGSSMAGAGYRPGEIVLIAPLDRVLPKFGSVVAAKIGAQDPIIKRYQPDGLFSEFASGSKVKVTVPAGETAQIIGTVVWHIRDTYSER